MSVNGEVLGIDECFVEESSKRCQYYGWPFSQV